MRRALVLLPFLLLIACAEAPDDGDPGSGTAPGGCQDRPGITYRTDARLQFLRPDGAVVKEIDVEIADADSMILRGLMDRRCLPDDWGMLFAFRRAQPRTFYMANTPRSLDIMFFGADSAFVSAAEYTEPFSPTELPSEEDAKFVVETPAGFADRYGIDTGTRIAWRLNYSPDASPPDDSLVAPPDSVQAAP